MRYYPHANHSTGQRDSIHLVNKYKKKRLSSTASKNKYKLKWNHFHGAPEKVADV